MSDQNVATPTRRGFLRGAGLGAAAVAAGLTIPALPGVAGRANAYPAPPVEGFVVPISRQEVIDRAMFWVNNPRPYNMQGFDVGPENDRNILWRTDCSGFVSMALKARFTDNPTGQTTETLHPALGYNISHEIKPQDLKAGDFVLQRNQDSSTGIGHVVLFHRWLDDQGTYEGMEQAGGVGTTMRPIKFGYDGLPGYHAFRYNHIRD